MLSRSWIESSNYLKPLNGYRAKAIGGRRNEDSRSLFLFYCICVICDVWLCVRNFFKRHLLKGKLLKVGYSILNFGKTKPNAYSYYSVRN